MNMAICRNSSFHRSYRLSLCQDFNQLKQQKDRQMAIKRLLYFLLIPVLVFSCTEISDTEVLTSNEELRRMPFNQRVFLITLLFIAWYGDINLGQTNWIELDLSDLLCTGG